MCKCNDLACDCDYVFENPQPGGPYDYLLLGIIALHAWLLFSRFIF